MPRAAARAAGKVPDEAGEASQGVGQVAAEPLPVAGAAPERIDLGKQARARVPRSSHAAWTPPPGRRDPVEILAEQDEARLPWLVPVRHGRMAESAFAFYRGAAAIMAADLANSPTIGVDVQLCGDAHLANFGTFASPERRQVFDVNDFDETLPGPWEWDVKRLATSFVLACRDNGYPDRGHDAAHRVVTAYREAIGTFAKAPTMRVWYWQADLDSIERAAPSKADRDQLARDAAMAARKTSRRALKKLTETVDGTVRIRSQPPLLVPLRELSRRFDPDELREGIEENYRGYVASLASDRAHLLRRFRAVDLALKVVGVGSVGTRCFIVLLAARDHGEPLFLQVKQATSSVLEPHLVPSTYRHRGERVVAGQRLIQASTDIFLGWSERTAGPHYYWRQFHDMKGSADVAAMSPSHLSEYARLCGATLAHAHARSGDAATIHGYLGKGHAFDRAVAVFAEAYADQNDADFAAFTQAVVDGRIPADPEGGSRAAT